MNKLNFGNIEVSKGKFYENKKGIKLKDVDCSKIVISNKTKEIIKLQSITLDTWMKVLVHCV